MTARLYLGIQHRRPEESVNFGAGDALTDKLIRVALFSTVLVLEPVGRKGAKLKTIGMRNPVFILLLRIRLWKQNIFRGKHRLNYVRDRSVINGYVSSLREGMRVIGTGIIMRPNSLDLSGDFQGRTLVDGVICGLPRLLHLTVGRVIQMTIKQIGIQKESNKAKRLRS